MPFAIQITNPALEVRGVGPYAGHDVRSMMVRSHVCDFRQLGCPDSIFQSVLEKRSRTCVAARRGNNQQRVVIPAKVDWRQLEEQATLLRHAINQKQIWGDNDRAHNSRAEDWNATVIKGHLVTIESLKKRIACGAGSFSSLEDYQRAHNELQSLLAIVGKDAPSPQLS